MLREIQLYTLKCDRCGKEQGLVYPLKYDAIEAAQAGGWNISPQGDTCLKCTKLKDRMRRMRTVV